MGQSRQARSWPAQPVRHVWVQSPEEHRPPDPGLILDWRRDRGRWLAQVVVTMHRDGANATVLRWFDVHDLVPINSKPVSPDPRRWHRGWTTVGR